MAAAAQGYLAKSPLGSLVSRKRINIEKTLTLSQPVDLRGLTLVAIQTPDGMQSQRITILMSETLDGIYHEIKSPTDKEESYHIRLAGERAYYTINRDVLIGVNFIKLATDVVENPPVFFNAYLEGF